MSDEQAQDPPNTLYVQVPDGLLGYETFGVHVNRGGTVHVLQADFRPSGGPDGKDMTDQEKLADYDRMKSIYNRLLRGVETSPEELDFQVTLTLLASGKHRVFETDSDYSKFLDHINCYRAQMREMKLYIEKLVLENEDLKEALRGFDYSP